jgi:hypothetical protein
VSVYLIFVVMQPPDERPDDIVGVEYFARRSGLSATTIRQGKVGTRGVPRARRRPLGWLRRDVDEFCAPKPKETPAQRAARLVEEKGRARNSRR